MISEAGLTNVRVAEFAWSLMEPSEGNFEFAWLKRAVDILHKQGIAVILGTPSAAAPALAHRKVSRSIDDQQRRNDGASRRPALYLSHQQDI